MAIQKKYNYLWIILCFGLGLLVAWLMRGAQTNPENEGETINQIAEVDGSAASDQSDGQSTSTYYEPQYSEDNPIPQSVDPFTPQDDFEVLLRSSKNKSDFDFSFEGYETSRTYQLNNGEVDFDLKGILRTGINMEDNVSLLVEFYTNDQISFTKRKKYDDSVLPFIKESKKRDEQDKNLYSFEFKKQLKIEPGLHYFTIVPQGRNRVLYVGKFEAK